MGTENIVSFPVDDAGNGRSRPRKAPSAKPATQGKEESPRGDRAQTRYERESQDSVRDLWRRLAGGKKPRVPKSERRAGSGRFRRSLIR